MTADKMMEQMLPSAEKNIKTRLVLEAIAKAENIEISDEKIDEKLAEMAKSYDMEVEKLKDLVGAAEKQQMKEMCIRDRDYEDWDLIELNRVIGAVIPMAPVTPVSYTHLYLLGKKCEICFCI